MHVRLGHIFFFGVICRWCAVLESEVMSTGLSRVFAGSLATLRAQEPHGRGSEKQWAMTAGRFASAGDRDIDFNIPWAWIYVRHFSCSEEINVRHCTNRHVHFAFHGKTSNPHV